MDRDSIGLLPCSIAGQHACSKCHLTTYTSSSGLKFLKDYSAEDQNLIARRSELCLDGDSQICLHHEALLLSKFEFLQKSCCNPFGKKGHAKRKDLRPIALAAAEKMTNMLNISIKPGQKLCTSCRKEFDRKHVNESSSTDSDDPADGLEISESVNTSLTTLGVSPVKFQRVSARDKRSYAKRKISQAQEIIAEQIATAANFDCQKLVEPNATQQCINCQDFEKLIEEMKLKLCTVNRQEKIQILTLVPQSWSIKKTSEQFKVTEYMVREARKLKAEQGILAIPKMKQGKVIPEEVKKRIEQFFEGEEFSRVCPGKKDCISTRINGEKVHKQKYLLLSNLKEMFVEYRERYGSEIGFSKFCELRPKWCVTVGSSGMHSVCVCTIHQNVKLMLAATPIKEDYKTLIAKTVCSIESKACMLHQCESCPGNGVLETFLEQVFEEQDPENVIAFKQWIHTDRDMLDTKQLTIDEFIEELVSKILNLSAHQYIAKHQSQHLRQLKENLGAGDLIVLMDFAENYSFIVQDAVQGFHWDNSQATLHPFVVYYKQAESLSSISYCVISDCLRHDTVAVHVFLQKLINCLKSCSFTIAHIHYFSDGSAAQYKNFKNFINLCNHKKDFGISAEWNFFATSHGKSPCDGIGGTVKRLAARASLQRPNEDQILTPVNLFEFCCKYVNGINFLFAANEEIEAARMSQEVRFSNGRTIPGTRDNHHFVPVSEREIRVSRVSNDTFSFLTSVDQSAEIHFQYVSIEALHPGQYIACIYENHWWIGNVCEISFEERDALINFMHPHGLVRAFHWPVRQDTCWIPEQQIIATIPAPTAASLGRQYSLPEPVILSIHGRFQLFKQ